RATTRQETDLSGPGWKLWYDKDAAWKEDELFLPPADLGKLPVNEPTGGWATLDSAGATAGSVQGTVEEYLQNTPGPDGAMPGVSWWYRTIRIPDAPSDSRSPRKLL